MKPPVTFGATQRVRDEVLDETGLHLEDITENVETISDAAAEKADYTCCVLVSVPLLMDGNLTGPCSICRRTLQFRPHAPKAPPKICVECAALMMRPN